MFNSDQKRAFAAVLLSGVVLFSWQYYFTNKIEKKAEVTSQTKVSSPTNNAPTVTTSDVKTSEVTPNQVISNIGLKSKDFSYDFSNNLVLTNANNSSVASDLSNFSGTTDNFKIQILNDSVATDLSFDLVEKTENKFVGKNQQFEIVLTTIIDEKGKLNINLKSLKPYKYKITLNAKEHKLDNGQHRQFVIYDNDVTFLNIPKEKEKDGNIKWLGTDYNYHLFAFVFKDKTLSKLKSTEQGNLYLETVNPATELNGTIVYTKKNYDNLIHLGNDGDNLHLSVDFGFFAILAVPILRGLQFIYKYIPNYGVAIILLTMLIRLITFPMQYKSFKSMKKMQQIQPELQKIKEKYKDDSQKMQKETMALFQKAGANPLSGCLPLLLQMPFFFAIYRVLYSAVELVGAPFFGWIHDLSTHDPFYILPVLMAGSMFLQQKLTPQTSMDPNQQKVMMFMPLIFGFIMKNLPAGLVLYIFVSTMIQIIQQYFVNKAID